MTPSETKCHEKTGRGNVYGSAKRCKRAASGWQRFTGKKMHAYRCPHCGHYHVGSHKPPLARKEVTTP